MDLKRLKYFCTVVESGNISKAAQQLYMSQPPLSKRLHELYVRQYHSAHHRDVWGVFDRRHCTGRTTDVLCTIDGGRI